MTDWAALTARAAFASHRLIGWIYWDPAAVDAYRELGVDGGFGYYVATRAAPLAAAGHQAVAAAFYSIHAGFVEAALGLAAAAASWEEVAAVRDRAVVAGLRTYVPEICDELATYADRLWDTADRLPGSGKVLFAAHRQWPRPDDRLLSAWLALNCLREFRGDTHFALLLAADLSGVQAGLLHDAHLNYPGDWIPRSRGADDAALDTALSDLEARGLAEGGVVNAAGRALRQEIEDRTDALTAQVWQTFGEEHTLRYLELVEPVGERLLARIDETAGPNWMPAARRRR